MTGASTAAAFPIGKSLVDCHCTTSSVPVVLQLANKLSAFLLLSFLLFIHPERSNQPLSLFDIGKGCLLAPQVPVPLGKLVG